jgi:hypothetical protein
MTRFRDSLMPADGASQRIQSAGCATVSAFGRTRDQNGAAVGGGHPLHDVIATI